MKRHRIIIILALVLLLAIPIWFFCDARGKVISVNDFTESDILSISDSFCIKTDSTDRIEAFEYRTYTTESFYVLRIKTDNKDTFISNNTGFEYVEKLPSGFYLLPNNRFKPKKSKTIYYTDDYIYISVWSFENNDIPKLFSTISDNQQN